MKGWVITPLPQRETGSLDELFAQSVLYDDIVGLKNARSKPCVLISEGGQNRPWTHLEQDHIASEQTNRQRPRPGP